MSDDKLSSFTLKHYTCSCCNQLSSRAPATGTSSSFSPENEERMVQFFEENDCHYNKGSDLYCNTVYKEKLMTRLATELESTSEYNCVCNVINQITCCLSTIRYEEYYGWQLNKLLIMLIMTPGGSRIWDCTHARPGIFKTTPKRVYLYQKQTHMQDSVKLVFKQFDPFSDPNWESGFLTESVGFCSQQENKFLDKFILLFIRRCHNLRLMIEFICLVQGVPMFAHVTHCDSVSTRTFIG